MSTEKLAGWFIELTQSIAFHNCDGEIEKLCKAVNIEYEELKDLKITDQAQEIAGTMVFRNKVGKLIEYLKKNRPRVQPFAYHAINLDFVEAQAEAAIRLGDPLLKFLSNRRVRLPEKGKHELWYHQLSKVLESYYSDTEFKQMCVDLKLNYGFFSSLKKTDKASEMVAVGIQYGLIKRILDYCQRNRPRVQPLSNQAIDWGNIADRANAAFKEGNPLHDPKLASQIRKNG